MCFGIQPLQLAVQRKHSRLELFCGHTIIFDGNAHIAAGIQGVALILDAVFTFNLGRLTQTNDIPIFSVREPLCQPVDLLLPVALRLNIFILGNLWCCGQFLLILGKKIRESLCIAFIQPSDNTQVSDLLLREFAMRSVDLGKYIAGVDKQDLVLFLFLHCRKTTGSQGE